MEPYGWLAIMVGVLIVYVGATVQGTIGFGINMLSAPVIALVAPRALPGSVVLVAFPLCVLSAWRERESLDRSTLRWMYLGVLPGTAVGLVIVALVNQHELAAIIGIITLACVLLSVVRFNVRVGPVSSFTASVVANVFGTASGTSGAPVALLFQHEYGPRTRATLSAFFCASASTSIVGYLALGKLGRYPTVYALILLPAMLAGLWTSSHLRARVDGPLLRPSVLTFTAFAGAAALLRGLT